MINAPQIDQNQLITELRLKNKEAFNNFYRSYSPAIYGVIFRIVNDEDVAKEILQDAFLKFWQKIDQYDPEKGRLFTWMINISRNLAIDKIRSKELRKAEKTDTLENYVTTIDRDHQGSVEIDSIGLKESLHALRDEERFILEMSYFKGYTQSEISDEFEIPLGTVKTRLRMGLKNLRNALKVE